MTSVLGIVASPGAGGHTTSAVRAVLDGAEQAGATTRLLELSQTSHDDARAAIIDADGIVFGSPVYRAGPTAMLRSLLESIQRGAPGEASAPLRGKATAIVMTGASLAHYLAPEELRPVLASFFAAQVLSPALYLDATAFAADKSLTSELELLARRHGAALHDLAAAVRVSEVLRTMEPQV